MMDAYIDQKATVESLNAMKPFLRDRGQVQLLRRIMNHIGKIPVADVVPVVNGRWVYDEHEMEYSCSVCLHEAPVGMTTYYTTKYCPNCGARMDGD